MNPKLFPVLVLAIVLVALIGLGQPFYVVDEREQVVVTRFNKPIRVIVGDFRSDFETLKAEIIQSATRSEGNEGAVVAKGLEVSQGAGLYLKMPFIDNVETFPDTILEYDAEPADIVTRDKKKLIVDNFARWRIENPLLFRVRVRTEIAARGSLDDVIYSVMREELGKNNLIEVIRTTKVFKDDQPEDEGVVEDALTSNAMGEILERGREEIMNTVTRRADAIAQERYGIRVIDVRIKRAELLPENLQAVFLRMQAERERISKGYRSEGSKEAAIIMGNTDKTVAVLIAEAKASAEQTRGEGDAEALRIYADAFGRNVELYKYIRGLEVMTDATPPGSELIIGLDSSIYQMMKPE